MSKETVKIDVAVLTKQVNDGMKKDALAKHYGISVVQMGVALKNAGLKIRKFHKPAFELVNTTVATTDVANTTAPEAEVEETVTTDISTDVATTADDTNNNTGDDDSSATVADDASDDTPTSPTTEGVTWEH